jgi:DNA-binding NarL/FixJ family response regulator
MAQTLHGLEPSTRSDARPLRVLVAQAQGLVRAGLRALLDSRDGIVVAAEAATADEAVAAARDLGPDVVLMDLDLPDAGGIEATRRLLGVVPGGATSVVMLMPSDGEAAVLGALRAGATGILLDDADPDELAEAVRVVARGEALLAPGPASRLVSDFMSRPERLRPTSDELAELTAREREVVALVACGLSNEEIAEELVVARATAKTHVSRALCKLHARDRAQLVVLAYEAGFVRPGRPVPAQGRSAPPVTRLGRRAERGRLGRPALRPVAA